VVPAIPGLRYFPDFIDRAEHDRLLAASNSHGWQRHSERGVQIYGYSYHRLKGGIYPVDGLPHWAAEVALRLCRDGLMPYLADQLIVNEYPTGAGIPPHVDAPAFDDTIVSVSLGSTCVMLFTEAASGRAEEMFLEPQSALVFAGEARHRWKHSIPPRPNDTWNGQVVPRGTRVSLTFRKMVRTSGIA
jgi:alkylated DNA repair dioxygenase AlkB